MNRPRDSNLFMGLMSGTSLDGVDAVLVDFSATPRTLGHAFTPFGQAFKKELLELNKVSHNELHRAALASNALSSLYAQTCNDLLAHLKIPTQRIQALGAHGQTIRHQPQAHDAWGYSSQLLSGHLLAELTGIDVIHDFRSRDIVAGGQGAPLVPAFHQYLFRSEQTRRVILNIGGMSNVSILAPIKTVPPAPTEPDSRFTVTGFDCGPGNVLMDLWCLQHTGQTYDKGGQWAQGGHANEALLAQLLTEPFFHLKPPKSTGRDLFNASWLEAHLTPRFDQLSAQDVQATLCALTAHSILQSIDACLRDPTPCFAPATPLELVVCGGGALNATLMNALKSRAGLFTTLAQMRLLDSDALGCPAQQVEAFAFAWLARQRVLGLSANLPPVTGAKGPRILGSWIKA